MSFILSVADKPIMLGVVLLSVVMLSVVMLIVMVPSATINTVHGSNPGESGRDKH